MQVLYPNMLHEYMTQRVKTVNQERLERLAKVKTRKQAKQYCLSVQRKIRSCFAPFPLKTPLNIQIVKERACDGYTLQNILFESRPGYLVSGNFYIPDGNTKVPVVLSCCGHSLEGKADPGYQSYCQALAKQGYLVLITDPVSQGERYQFEDGMTAKTWDGKRCVFEHNYIGKIQRLNGDFFGTWRVWDKIRALDVLLKHPRADKSRVGVTGNSGGGTLSNYLNALDSRVTMVAPGCWITTFLHNIENTLPTDAEQVPPGILKYGLDMIDFILARAPRASLLLGQQYDFFDPRGLQEAYQQANRIYKLLGAEDNLKLFIGPQGHGYSRENREVMYKFFNKHAGIKAITNEDKLCIKPVKPAKLLASPKGDVHQVGSKKTWELNAEQSRQLKACQKKLSKKELVKTLETLLKLPQREGICHYRSSQLQHSVHKKFKIQTHYLVETEPGIKTVLARFCKECPDDVYVLRPPQEMDLYIPHLFSIDEVDKIKSDEAWFVEPRGIGNSCPQDLHGYDFFQPYGLDYMYTVTADMLGEVLYGQRIHDVLCVIDLLLDNGVKKIHLHGCGQNSPMASIVELLHPAVKSLTLLGGPKSYYDLTQKPLTPWPASMMIPDILKYTSEF